MNLFYLYLKGVTRLFLPNSHYFRFRLFFLPFGPKITDILLETFIYKKEYRRKGVPYNGHKPVLEIGELTIRTIESRRRGDTNVFTFTKPSQ